MSDQVKLASLRAVALRALLDEVKKAYEAARAEADEQLIVLYDQLGAPTLHVKIPGCPQAVAQLSLSEPKPGFVIDEAGLLAWCKREHPTEVQVTTPEPVESVRPAWRKVLLSRLCTVDGKVVDEDTGRELTFAEPGPPSTTLTWKPAGRDEVARAYRDGRPTLGELLALPSELQD